MDPEIEDDEEDQEQKPNWRRQLEKDREDAKARAETAEKENAELRQKMTAAEVGLDLSDKKVQRFMKSYEGEWNAEALKADWEETFGTAPVKEETPAEEIAAHERVAAGAAGTVAPGVEGAADKLQRIVNRIRAGDAEGLDQNEVKQAIREAGFQVGRGFEDRQGGFEPLS